MIGYIITTKDGFLNFNKKTIKVGEVYTEKNIKLHKKGFHFIPSLISYSTTITEKWSKNIEIYRYYRIEALGDILHNSYEFCTNKIKILEEISKEEVIGLSTGSYKFNNGTTIWCKNSLLHKEDGAAIEFSNGTNEWYFDGKMIRKDTDIIQKAKGTKFWCLDGELHRDDGPALELSNGTKYWYKNGDLHRDDGPSIEKLNGYKAWFINGVRVRIFIPSNIDSVQNFAEVNDTIMAE